MKRVNYLVYSLVGMLLLCTLGCSEVSENKNVQVGKIEKVEKKNDKIEKVVEEHQSSIEKYMPEKWKVLNSRIIPVEKLDFYSRSFGGEIVNLENNFIASSEPYNPYKFQINIIKASEASEAKKIFETIYSRTSNKDKYLLREDVVYEFMANDEYVAKCRLVFEK